jgi:hypothetical protein
MALRYSGQEGAISIIDSTTQDALIPDVNIESFSFSFPYELVKKEFIGELGPDYREFADGYEFGCKAEINNAAQFVTFVNLLKAKAEGKSADEFAAQIRMAGPDASTLQITFRDIHWEGLPFDLGSRTDFLTLDLKGKGKSYKVQIV